MTPRSARRSGVEQSSADEGRRIPLKSSRARIEHRSEPAYSNDDDVSEKISEERVHKAALYSMQHEASPARHISHKHTKKQRSYRTLYIVIGVAVVIAGALSLFSGAKVYVTPKTKTLTFNGNFNAGSAESYASLAFTLSTTSAITTELVPMQKSVGVATKARGVITLYNEFAEKPQRFVARTRLTTPEGIVYRLDNGVVVPGYTKKNGIITPGAVKISVTADATGTQGNQSALTQADEHLSLPGLKGTPRYEKVYARITSDIKGGREAIRYIIATSTKIKTDAAAREALYQNILQKLPPLADEHDVRIINQALLTVEELEPVPRGDTSAELRYIGTLTIPTFSEKSLISGLFSAEAALTGGIAQTRLATSSIIIDFSGLNAASFSKPRISLPIKGSATLVGNIPVDDIKKALQGVHRSDVSKVFVKFPSIQSAEAVLTPFWRSAFPSDDSIDVIVR
jgi:hypothetical protein